MNLFQVLGGLTPEEEQEIRDEAAATFPDTLMTMYGGIDTIYDDQGRRRDYHGMPVDKYSANELQKALDVNASRSQIREGIFDKVLTETGNLSMATDAAQAADFAPIVGTAIGVEEGEIARQEIMPYLEEGKYYDAGVEGAKTLLGYGQAAASALPVVGGAVRTANRVMPEVMADAVGLGRAIYNRDLDGIGEVFTRSRPPQSLGAAGIGDNGGPRMPVYREVDGQSIFDYLSSFPHAQEIVTGEPRIPMEGVTRITSQKPDALRNFTSLIADTGELKKPRQIESMSELEGSTLHAIVGDNSGRHDVIEVNGRLLENPVRSMAGFQYTDIDGHGYAGDLAATTRKMNAMKETDDPVAISALMGEESSDFSRHLNNMFVEMLKYSKVKNEDVKKVDEAIRSIGKPKSVNVVDDDGNIVRNANGKPKKRTITEYPFTDAPTVADREAFANYVNYLPSGTHRAYLAKGMDKKGLKDMGMPTVFDARLAVTDPEQMGMEFGTTGYRLFRPDLEKGVIPTSPEMSTTYQYGYDKVGPSMTFTNDEFRGFPAGLIFHDLSDALRAKPKGNDGGLLYTPPMYKILEMSPKRAQQPVTPLTTELADTMMEIEKRNGRRASLSFANDVLGDHKITSKIIEYARKKNAPTWMIGAMMTQQAMQGEE